MTDLLTIPEIAAMLRVSVKTVRDRYVQHPEFPPPVLAPSLHKRLWSGAEVTAWATPAGRKSTHPRRAEIDSADSL